MWCRIAAALSVFAATSVQAEETSIGSWTLVPGTDDCALTAPSVDGAPATLSLIASDAFGWTIEIRSDAWTVDSQPAIGPDGHVLIGMTGIQDVPPGLLGFTASDGAAYLHGTDRQEDVIFVFNYLAAADAGDSLVGLTDEDGAIVSQFDVDGFISGSRALEDCTPTG